MLHSRSRDIFVIFFCSTAASECRPRGHLHCTQLIGHLTHGKVTHPEPIWTHWSLAEVDTRRIILEWLNLSKTSQFCANDFAYFVSIETGAANPLPKTTPNVNVIGSSHSRPLIRIARFQQQQHKIVAGDVQKSEHTATQIDRIRFWDPLRVQWFDRHSIVRQHLESNLLVFFGPFCTRPAPYRPNGPTATISALV